MLLAIWCLQEANAVCQLCSSVCFGCMLDSFSTMMMIMTSCGQAEMRRGLSTTRNELLLCSPICLAFTTLHAGRFQAVSLLCLRSLVQHSPNTS